MKDVNGTRYHLFLGRDDWNRSQTVDGGARKWEYDLSSQAIALQGEIFRFYSPVAPALDPDQRRDSDRDAFGHSYWIGREGTTIWARWAKASQTEVIFPRSPAPCLPLAVNPFQPAAIPPRPSPEPLAGLAVLPEGYLVVGSPTTGSLLVFDLYALDGVALRLPLPPANNAGERSQPFALAALPSGGLLVLDRAHRQVWRLDNHLRPLPARSPNLAPPELFGPPFGLPRRRYSPAPATAISLVETTDSIAIAPQSDGSFWILDDRGGDPSAIWLYDPPQPPQSVLLETANLVDVGVDALNLGAIWGYDLAFVGDRDRGTLWLVDRLGKQAYALQVTTDAPLTLRIERQYYPLRNFAQTSLIADAPEVYYRQKSDRWLPLRALPQQRYEEEDSLLLPQLDGRDPACVWHRICLDACLPPETALQIETRAADNPDDLVWTAWQIQPTPYRRPTSELPLADLWSDRGPDSFATWELLLQQVRGRYLELKLTLMGNGRATPKLRALRAYYPRFSYPREYLPDIYQQDPVSFDFLERFFANPEGILTVLEGAIAEVQALFDIRTVPNDALDWLASWLGLAFDPAWTDHQRRLLIANAPYFFQRRGTVLGLRQGILLAIHPELGDRIFRDDSDTICPTVRIIEQFLTRTQPAVVLGDPNASDLVLTGNIATDARARAHRFTVMLPTTLSADSQRLIAQLIDLEKPAHTAFNIRQYWALFRVGEVRLGLDTLLGEGGRIEPLRLGQSALAEAALSERFPYNLSDRTVISHP